MTGNLKALGLALLAAFALGVIVAQGASAAQEEHQFVTTGETTTVLTGHQETGENHETLSIGGETTITCHIVTSKGTMQGTNRDHISLAPTFDECHSNINTQTGSVTIHTNGCTFTYDSDTDEGHAPISLTCPEGQEITITKSGCTIHIPPFTERYGVTYTNVTENNLDAVTIKSTVTGIPATSTGGLACLAGGLGFEHKTHEATLTGATRVTGYEDQGTEEEGAEHKYNEGEQTNIAVTGTP